MNRERMKDYQYPFAAWELRLYLDTHPEDEKALKLFRQMCEETQNKCNYACAVTDTAEASACSCCSDGGKVWSWISDPWPWEPEANCIGGR